MTHGRNWTRLKPSAFVLWKKKNISFNTFLKPQPGIGSLVSTWGCPLLWIRGLVHHYGIHACQTFYPVFLAGTLPVTNSTQWISGITDHHITVDKKLQDMKRFIAFVMLHLYTSTFICEPSKRIIESCWNYLGTQVFLIVSKGKHLDLKALKVRGILNSGINPNWMEDHLVWVYSVCTPGIEKVKVTKSAQLVWKINRRLLLAEPSIIIPLHFIHLTKL